jgi:protocatechuate 3,4-dioxygenase beta subunit
VTFTTIYPGWYQGRATHIHVEVADGIFADSLASELAAPSGDPISGYVAAFQVGIAL